MSKDEDKLLVSTIGIILSKLEASNDIVICNHSPDIAAKTIADAVEKVVPATGLTLQEMQGVRALINEAISHRSFFDWEMPTLTGYGKKQFAEIANKLPRG